MSCCFFGRDSFFLSDHSTAVIIRKLHKTEDVFFGGCAEMIWFEFVSAVNFTLTAWNECRRRGDAGRMIELIQSGMETGDSSSRVKLFFWYYYFLLVISLVRSVTMRRSGPSSVIPLQIHWGQTSLPLTLHLHTDWLRVRWPLFPHWGRAIRTCTSFRVTCLLWECRPMIGCAGACGCGLPCGCDEGGGGGGGGGGGRGGGGGGGGRGATEWVISENVNQPGQSTSEKWGWVLSGKKQSVTR